MNMSLDDTTSSASMKLCPNNIMFANEHEDIIPLSFYNDTSCGRKYCFI